MRKRARQGGYLLASVGMLLVVAAAVVFLLSSSGVVGNASARAIASGDRLELAASAGLAHARWASQATGCAANLGMASSALGGVSVSASATAGGGSVTAYAFVPNADAWIEESAPASNHGSDADLRIQDGTGQRQIGLLRFDLSALPSGARVVEATLLVHATESDRAGAVEVRALQASWLEGSVTWAQIASAVDTGGSAVLPPQPSAPVDLRVNLSELAQAWANAPTSNFGIALVARSSSGLRTRVATREAASAQRPVLRVVVATSALSLATIQAVSALPPGTTRTLIASGVRREQTGAELLLQTAGAVEDAYLDASSATLNYGSAVTLRVSRVGSEQAALLRFDLSALPADATILQARVGLYLESAQALAGGTIAAQRATRSWTEAGATHQRYDAANSWSAPGGDYEPRALDERTFSAPTPGFYEWDVTPLARAWHSGDGNAGVLLRGTSAAVDRAVFTSSEAADVTRGPYLRLALGCACGATCNLPRRTGALLLVVGDKNALAQGDVAARAAFAGWGYAVTLADDDASSASLASDASANDAVYVAASADPAKLTGKLAGLVRGIVSEEPGLAAELGLATSFGSSSSSSVTVSNTAHEISRAFAAQPLTIHEQTRQLTTLAGTLAPGLTALATVASAPSLAALEKGAARSGGGSASGRRVMLPIGASAIANWTQLTSGGQTLVRRAVDWATRTPAVAKTPIAHWKLDEGTGLVARDSVGGHHAALIGPVTWTSAGQLDGAVRFASGASVRAPHHAALTPTAALTIAAWTYLDRATAAGTYEIVSKENAAATAGYYFEQESGDLWFGSGASYATAGVSLTPRMWHHVAVTFADAANEVVFFVDGVERRRATFASSISGSTGEFTIGNQPSFNYFWNGFLDDVRLYDAALTPAEIAVLVAPGGAPGPGGGTCKTAAADDFESEEYYGSTGTIPWASDWIEFNDDGDPDEDDERVLEVGTTLAVRLCDNDGGGEGVERSVVPPAGATAATLSFSYWREKLDDANDYVVAQLSADGGAWIEVARISGPGTDSKSSPAQRIEVDVSARIGSIMRLRFLTSPALGGGDLVYVDDVNIAFAAPCP